ncbi:hypothetical protein FJTKL_08898 [Diaporthe vaccinii]|uniref:Zn(2)-C6 fungal-type domain-containing protein n=1 Tax=Diaporthe vaccinii TaxID=105482 RepID=A0ABR4EQ06_9PEZI
MDGDGHVPAPTPPGRRPQRPQKTRPRVGATCARCQKGKIRCDALVPACSPYQKASVECIGAGTSREIPRGYVNGLETRVKWLESLLREKVPGITLDSPNDGTAGLPSPDQGNSETQGSLRNISEQIGLLSIASGTDLRYVGPSSGLFFTRYVLAGLAKQVRIEKPIADASDRRAEVPADLLVVQPKDLPSDQRQAR